MKHLKIQQKYSFIMNHFNSFYWEMNLMAATLLSNVVVAAALLQTLVWFRVKYLIAKALISPATIGALVGGVGEIIGAGAQVDK